MIYLDESSLWFLHTAILLFINLMGYGILNILNDRSRHSADRKVNSQPTRKF